MKKTMATMVQIDEEQGVRDSVTLLHYFTMMLIVAFALLTDV